MYSGLLVFVPCPLANKLLDAPVICLWGWFTLTEKGGLKDRDWYSAHIEKETQSEKKNTSLFGSLFLFTEEPPSLRILSSYHCSWRTCVSELCDVGTCG